MTYQETISGIREAVGGLSRVSLTSFRVVLENLVAFNAHLEGSGVTADKIAALQKQLVDYAKSVADATAAEPVVATQELPGNGQTAPTAPLVAEAVADEAALGDSDT